jgi:SpoVK/Ycf46/Vps4 family AAA+-type ATPase
MITNAISMQPNSDTKRYQELFDEALRRIPAHSPQWTNFNQSDPGITLVQLFAWVAETLGFRFDRIPESHRAVLRKFAAHLRKSAHVLMLGRNKKDRSAPVQFIASELGLNPCRVDLTSVVSKYIGETEKNLRQLFDAAKNGGAILFLDEADAMFGKRTNTKDSHDRYANIEVNYLLKRIDEFEGIAIVAGRSPENFDAAFLHQFRWIVSLSEK